MSCRPSPFIYGQFIDYIVAQGAAFFKSFCKIFQLNQASFKEKLYANGCSIGIECAHLLFA